MASASGPEWIYETGIGEKRALLVDEDTVLAARVFWPSKIAARTIVMAKVLSRQKNSARGVCVTDEGHEINVSDLPRDASEGKTVRIIITREPMAESGRLKRANGRHFGDRPDHIPPPSVFTTGRQVQRLPAGMWEEVWSLASDAQLAFAGGNLVFSVTPAMTLIDIDGYGSPRELSLAAVPAIAQALQWMDLGGSIGIDFPTVPDKAGRKQVDAALEEALCDWPHERTAMNGFGFVQLVARLEEPSLLHRCATRRVDACARMALRRAEFAEGTGCTVLLRVHPALKAKLREEWIAELAKRTGKYVRIETDPKLALSGAFAQIVSE